MALDHRFLTFHEEITPGDLLAQVVSIKARIPRSCSLVNLSTFDKELGVLLGTIEGTLYYMPVGTNRCKTYYINVRLDNTTLDLVDEVAKVSLDQSLSDEGAMKVGEIRMYWIRKSGAPLFHPALHTTVQRDRHHYRVAVEVVQSASSSYKKMYSFSFPIQFTAQWMNIK